MTGAVRLEPVDEGNLEPLLSVAAAEAEPEDVMPPVEAPAGWSLARRDAFRDFYRASFGGLEGPTRTRMYAIIAGGEVVGMVRMTRCAEPGTVETGMWLGRSARGQGLGAAALRELLHAAAAAGMHTVVAETTPDNRGAISVLEKCGAELREDGGKLRAKMCLDSALPAR
ncbi:MULTISPECIES: GNAT family N-acetyltransferase [Micromonospora]|uniref:GNAT family N-acetyltransferase n=1 Tax=Micromonospora solifontis TaxID=2487138 RepID=A0ABX9WE00_9ACTN|nr:MULTISPECIES: GNAT family N-acetyltransferase [Micromonospora]NES16729.1 GNAT family N-acetyltransferase [Micromonospora sp. PPF5-17B]NES37703.1 GNAT family N-acetyltransferase [Micromonospora solifontis]NES58441.1 GNAT family N-acetyltransferase [Micromonospora sp. PPF5-6]RNL98049.1 GNAT family N-acetyltransferase [Micromonospora solifontis]